FIDDAFGFCWMSTNKGLFKASFNDLINAYEKGSQGLYYHYFGKKDGMDITELNGGCYPCAVQLPNGQISFPSMDGLVWANPALPVFNMPDGKLFIDAVTIDGENILLDSTGTISVPASGRELLIWLAFTEWGNASNINIQYQLSTQPNQWISLDPLDNGKIRINQLSAGDYELRIRKLKGFGIDNYTISTLPLSVVAPWYKRWWFVMLGFISLIALLLGVFKFMEKQFKAREQKLEKQVSLKTAELNKKNIELEKSDNIKTRLISIISHDIVTPLRFLHMAGKNLKENKKQMPEALQDETVDEITNTSKELELLTTNILNWIKYQNEDSRLMKERFDLYELVQQVFRTLYALAKQREIVFVNNIAPNTHIYQYTDLLRIVIYNLVLNAINFMEQGKIIINCYLTPRSVQLNVQDEGVGMTPEQINHIMSNEFILSSANVEQRKGNGLGYIIIKDLLKIMGGTKQILSENNVGTTVIIKIPNENILT
ncbi:MAG: HAMP domain-containing sensor histidine kinase, partial [Ferruginibacter sp.]